MYGDQVPSIIEVLNLTEVNKRRNMQIVIDEAMAWNASKWNKKLDEWPADKRPQAPVVFGFFIYKHILFIATLNASDPDAKAHIPIQLNMGEKNQHQWNALAVMVTICWARDIMMRKIVEMNIQPVAANPEVDVDI